MKKAFAMIAVMGLAASPLIAAPVITQTLDSSNATMEPWAGGGVTGNRGAAQVYNNYGFTSGTSYVSQLSAGFIIDDYHISASQPTNSLGIYRFIGSAPAATQAMTLAFFTNPGGANTSVGATIGAFGVNFGSVPTGFFNFGINFQGAGVFLPADFWVGIRTSAVLTTYAFTAPQVIGTSSPTFATGFPQLVTYTPSGFSLASTVDVVPEPAAVALLTLGGLVALRRRRAA